MRTIDGMRMSSAYNVAASTRNQVNQVMVQEIVLDTSAASVETESSGMNMNVVPKDGGTEPAPRSPSRAPEARSRAVTISATS